MWKKSPVPPIISVIVATRNRRIAVSELLAGLSQLEHGTPWELIVADNGSNDGTAELLASAATALPITTVYEPHPGKSRALNRAMTHARGEILLFTDDDSVPDRQSLIALYRAAADYPAAKIFGGRVLVHEDAIPLWLARSHNLQTMLASVQDFGPQVCWFPPDMYPVGPNLAVRRCCLRDARHGWPINLGPGTKIPLGDERAFLMQISSPSERDRLYVPECIVWHNLKHRSLSVPNAMRRCFFGGYAASLTAEKSRTRFAVRVPELLKRAQQRIRFCNSIPEVLCMLARAAGVAAGVATPFRQIAYG